jgi:hypothetical protein
MNGRKADIAKATRLTQCGSRPRVSAFLFRNNLPPPKGVADGCEVETAPDVGPQARLYFTIIGFGDCRGVPIASGVFCELPLSLSLFLPGTGKA